jgi:hypothetical protein
VTTFRYDYTIKVRRGNGPDEDTTITVRRPWSHPNAFVAGDLNSPQYSKLPPEIRWRTPDLEPMPPTRLTSQTGSFYQTSYPCEYIQTLNAIIEDVDPSAEGVREITVLDTLYQAQSVVLLITPPTDGSVQRAPTMTYYHGSQANQFVFTGFAPWLAARQDCIALFDFVLQDLWGLTRAPIDRGSFAPAYQRSGGSQPARSASPKRTANASVSTGTTRE